MSYKRPRRVFVTNQRGSTGLLMMAISLIWPSLTLTQRRVDCEMRRCPPRTVPVASEAVAAAL
jgi:hypothetical protein